MSILKLLARICIILVVKFEKHSIMHRFKITDFIRQTSGNHPVTYKDKLLIFDTRKFNHCTPSELFAIDSFAIGYVLEGSSLTEFNNSAYHLEAGSVFILTPTHTCRIIERSQDYHVRFVLIESDSYNLNAHMNYITTAQRWTRSYFNPVINLTKEESVVMNTAVNRIINQVRRPCPNQGTFIRLALEWHHVELDNIMQVHSNEWSKTDKPLTHQQELARSIYLLAANNYRKEHQIRYYSEKLCLTPQYINQIMNRNLGRSLSSILSELRFTAARSMLISTEMSIQEIADELNFSDQAAFCKFIKKASGLSPKHLRNTGRQDSSI